MATSRTSAPAFLLHSTPYRETSLVVDLFTDDRLPTRALRKGLLGLATHLPGFRQGVARGLLARHAGPPLPSFLFPHR